MTQSLMERLRDPRGFDWGDFYALTTEAADALEALKNHVKHLELGIHTLKSERDALVKALRKIDGTSADYQFGTAEEIVQHFIAIARAALGGEE